MENTAYNTELFSHKKPKRNRGIVWQVLFFAVAVLYGELLLRILNPNETLLSPSLVGISLFSLAAGVLVYLLLDLIAWAKLSRTLGGLLLLLGAVYLCVQHCCQYFFGTYYAVGYMAQMTGGVMGDFSANIGQIILQNIPFILLSLLPSMLFLFLRTGFFRYRSGAAASHLILLVVFVALQGAGSVLAVTGNAKNLYTYDFRADTAVREFGALTALRLEGQYAILGIPEEPMITIEIPTLPPETTPEATECTESTEETTVPDQTTEPPVVYADNVLPIDFQALQTNAGNNTLAAMHQYFCSLTPTLENEYTGIFEGKNLILITAEAFCPYVIDQTLTPTLYKLANESFQFTNFYQPDFGQSTAGGEFAVLTGLYPTWQGSNLALKASSKVSMPYTLGWAFRQRGYAVPAYHNNSYTYYDRHKTHPNFGYDWTAIGNGLTLKSDVWPNSDLEMMEATVDGYIQNYLSSGTPFHVYYMTVSGHANYNWGGNNMCRRHKEAAQAARPDASEAVQAYIACNLELEYAMAHLMAKLETAGIADDTVIVLTSDHYPYALTEGGTDYYPELSGIDDTVKDMSRYQNTLILWNGAMKDSVVVDTPCSSVDIVPTLCNLFGIDYDSRLYSGRDIFATNYQADQASTAMPLVVFPAGSRYSWITAAGSYNGYTGVFTPKEGIAVDEAYIDTVCRLANAKFSYAKQILQQDYYSIIEKALQS